MASTFNGVGLFNSGPHRFVMQTIGRLVIGPLRPPDFLNNSQTPAPLELRIVQTGRLTAATVAALWTQIDAIRAVAEGSTPGTLVDHHGRSWTNLRLIRFTPTGPIDRGRTVSQPYEAEYLRFGP